MSNQFLTNEFHRVSYLQCFNRRSGKGGREGARGRMGPHRQIPCPVRLLQLRRRTGVAASLVPDTIRRIPSICLFLFSSFSYSGAHIEQISPLHRLSTTDTTFACYAMYVVAQKLCVLHTPTRYVCPTYSNKICVSYRSHPTNMIYSRYYSRPYKSGTCISAPRNIRTI